MGHTADRLLKACTLIFGRQGRRAVKLPQHLLDEFAYDYNDDGWYTWAYWMVRSNNASLEDTIFGEEPSPVDVNLVRLLSFLDTRDDKHRVVLFLLAQLDGWFRAQENWAAPMP